MRHFCPRNLSSKKKKRWLTTTVFSSLHAIMELCENKIIITTFYLADQRGEAP